MLIIWSSLSFPQGDDYRMREIMHLAHEFLQHFCHNNHTNQGLLHRHLDLFLQTGDNVRVWECEDVEVGRSMMGRNTFCGYFVSVCVCCVLCVHVFCCVCIVGASLSKPHTSMTSLHRCVCMFACLDNHSIPALICAFYVMH